MAGRVAIIGAGIGGLAAALDLSARGREVVVLDRGPVPGGKIRSAHGLDLGPTALTLRWVFDGLFAAAGTTLERHLTLTRADLLGRHIWPDGAQLDLFADTARSAEAIAAFAGPAEARGYLAFCQRARATYDALEQPFLKSARPSPLSLVASAGLGRMMGLSPMTSLWDALGRHFADPRLRQVFARTANYVGTSPLVAPATLMLIAQVELDGVWLVEGGMQRLPQALADLATAQGAVFREAEVAEILTAGGRASGVRLADGEVIAAASVIANADPGALAGGLFGAAAARAVPAVGKRSFSAFTWALPPVSAPLARNTVFFPADALAEHADLTYRGRVATQPTVTVSRQDAGVLVMVNAPARGEGLPAGYAEAVFARLPFTADGARATTPADYARRYPGTGGALYGPAVHGWSATFSRPATMTRLPGLLLAGGGTHPGAGVAMAALSGRLAAGLA